MFARFGDVTGARAELERARAIFSRLGATTRRDAMEAELEQLVEGPAPATGPSTVQRSYVGLRRSARDPSLIDAERSST